MTDGPRHGPILPRLLRRQAVGLAVTVLALAASPVAHALPAGIAKPAAREVHPVDAKVGYGEWDARFGHFRNGHVHEGQDVFAPAGTPCWRSATASSSRPGPATTAATGWRSTAR